jgi:predicted MPP superfamily phosphohydrolase
MLLSSVAGIAATVDLLAFGDWGYGRAASRQEAVATRIERYVRECGADFDAVLLLGDNFYRELSGVHDRRWQTLFEEMYDPKLLPVPFYVALGNHDYDKKQLAAQFAYSRENPHSRFKLPAKWYSVDFPPNQPLVTILVLDSNWSRQTREERELQNRWLDQRLGHRNNGKWIVAVAHHPLFSNGRHGDTPVLIEDWGRLFRKHGLDLYLCGHDHNLQHLEIAGWPASFVVAGGGGAKLQDLRRDDRGPFSRVLHGFVHLQFAAEQAIIRYMAADGQIVHEFVRSADGQVKVGKTTGRDKPKPGKDEEDDD